MFLGFSGRKALFVFWPSLGVWSSRARDQTWVAVVTQATAAAVLDLSPTVPGRGLNLHTSAPKALLWSRGPTAGSPIACFHTSLSFYCWIISHCMSRPRFKISTRQLLDWVVSTYWLWWNAVMSLCVQIFMWTWIAKLCSNSMLNFLRNYRTGFPPWQCCFTFHS